mgnify:CR=1 FL=1
MTKQEDFSANFSLYVNQQVILLIYFVVEFWQFKKREWDGEEDFERENRESRKVSSRQP